MMKGWMAWRDNVDGHFCSPRCATAKRPCDLCLLQRKKKAEDSLREEGKPTLSVSLGDLVARKEKK